MDESKKFVLIFWFCAGMAASGLIFLAALIFVPIPKDNIQMANVALGFITGTLITAAIQYLTGGSPTIKKPETPISGDKPIINIDQTTKP